ncbi:MULTISPECIES: thiol-disulfide oxidoreductase DCC family protein [unclassified Bacillus (in: firmicutes)]|uniref:thiol-disulfide oxidoreductase DCC family protein n=1 Tax=unclassified Bacillus (in: firmicutes) TaxID=185979 RepID=UPI002035155E|nr:MULTISPECIES: thiol-disulfide oxidoreductase DCC family protein [unclassified Bacillus (in: firmicutes)]
MVDRIILFDGVCNLCNNSVKFIIKRDTSGYFKFASLQGETGQRLLKKHSLNYDLNSFVLIEMEKVYIKSSAALRVCSKLGGAWRILSIFRFLPPLFRDFLYDIVAKNRYKWFGKRESCILPLPKWKQRFLD